MNFVTLIFLISIYDVKFTKNQENNSDSENSAALALIKSVLSEKWLEVPLDHFNIFDKRIWKMRYLINDAYFKQGGPIFIEVGGEWTITGFDLLAGQLATLAKKHHGVLIETEHRYYGKSLPFGRDFSTKNLKYLQIEQALEDLAYFIEHFKKKYAQYKNSKVVLHGCSYSGMLATWMRLRFPHFVDIAYASSAPLGVGLDYPEYYEIVNDVYANVSSKCITTIKQGFTEITKLLITKEGRQKVRSALRGWNCGNVDEMNSLKIISKIIKILNVIHDPYQYEDIACLVMAMNAESLKNYERLINFIKFKSKSIVNCEDPADSSGEKNRTAIAWHYQTCTEMGTFQTLNRKNSHHPFAMDLTVEESIEDCVKDFGEKITEHLLKTGINRVRRRYGGKQPEVTYLITLQGTHDPWKHLAHLQDYTPEAPVWVFEGSHCADVVAREDDPPALEKIRKRVRDLISKWLEEIS